jgi:hypothetical protein
VIWKQEPRGELRFGDGKQLKRLEAEIGIEPMNKGFAVLAKLFAQVQPCFVVSIFIRVFGISSLPVIA